MTASGTHGLGLLGSELSREHALRTVAGVPDELGCLIFVWPRVAGGVASRIDDLGVEGEHATESSKDGRCLHVEGGRGL